MIDIESQVFTRVATAVRESFPGITAVSRMEFAPTAFPTICLEQMDSSTEELTSDSSGVEKHARLSYEINIYSNKAELSKSEAKAIMAVADDEMRAMGFQRLSCIPLAMRDARIYRLTARYLAKVGIDETIYGV